MINESQGVLIGGRAHKLRRSPLSAFRIGGLPYRAPEYNEGWDGNTLFRWAVIQAWAMLDDATAYASPEVLAESLKDEEIRPLLDAVNACLAEPTEQKKSSGGKRRSSSSKRV